MTKAPDPGRAAADIAAARDRLLAFTTACPAPDWESCVLADSGDPRPVAVVVDHVADAYEYLAGWIGEILAGASPAISPELVDALNARHAAAVGQVSQQQAANHLRRSGDAIIELVAGLTPDQLAIGDGLVDRLARIAARHADAHRSEIETALRA
jgi:hypothetical protein